MLALGAMRIDQLLLFAQSLSNSLHKSRANRGKTAVLIEDTDNYTVDGKWQHMAQTTSSAL